jgi:hypothetical protein
MTTRSNSLEIITSQQVTYGATGMPPSVSGLENLTRWTALFQREGTVVKAPAWLKLTIEDYEIIQIDTIFKVFPHQLKVLNKKENECLALKDKIDDMIDKIELDLAPPPKKSILSALDVLAKLFQVELPIGLGLDLLVRALEDIPSPLFKHACSGVTLSWKYAKFPPPAVFMEAINHDKTSGLRYLISLKKVSHALS